MQVCLVWLILSDGITDNIQQLNPNKMGLVLKQNELRRCVYRETEVICPVPAVEDHRMTCDLVHRHRHYHHCVLQPWRGQYVIRFDGRLAEVKCGQVTKKGDG